MNPLNLHRSLSSQCTTQLLKFRNPLGSEENWLNREPRIDNVAIYMGKVFVTEIGIAILCLTATVETVANGILFVGGLPIVAGCLCFAERQSPVNLFMERSVDYILNQLSSSGFTVYWNVANLFAFNIFCKNLFTNESFARYSMENTDRGKVFRAAIDILQVSLSIFAVLSGAPNPRFPPNFPPSFLRPADILYISDWSIHHRVFVNHISNYQNPALNNRQVEVLNSAIFNINQSIQDGAHFFKEFLFDPMDEATKIKIQDSEPEIFHFVLTRAIYFFAFGPKRNEPIPTFFKGATQLSIAQLRQINLGEDVTIESNAKLKNLFANLDSFNQCPKEEHIKRMLFNPLKEVAYRELQNSLFINRCWQQALLLE